MQLTRTLVSPPVLIRCTSCIYSNRCPLLWCTWNTICHKRTSSTGPCSPYRIHLWNRTVRCHFRDHTWNMWNCTEGPIWLCTAYYAWRGTPTSDNPRTTGTNHRLRLIRRASTAGRRYSTKSQKWTLPRRRTTETFCCCCCCWWWWWWFYISETAVMGGSLAVATRNVFVEGVRI